MPPDWQNDDRLQDVRSAADELTRRFPPDRCWGWKDPRNSLTLPFWKVVLPDLKVVACVRNPLDVASSLHHRGFSSYSFGLALWRTYNEQLFANSSPNRRIVVHYSNLFDNLRSELQRIAEFLELPVDRKQLTRACAIAKPNLRHHRFVISDLIKANVAPEVIDLYLQLCDESGWSETQGIEPGERPSTPAVRSLPASVADTHDRPQRSRCLTSRAEQPQAVIPLNSAVIEITELKEQLAGLRVQLRTAREQCRTCNERLARQAEDLAELQFDQERVDQKLQSALADISAQQHLSEAQRTDAGRGLRNLQAFGRFRATVRKYVPREAAVLIVSRGDEALLKLYERQAAHFPQIEGGLFSDRRPKCGLSAVAHLEALRAQGADYLAFPEMSLSWLDEYPDFHRHLQRRYRCLVHDFEAGAIFSLRERNRWIPLTETVAECRLRLGREPVLLNWKSRLELAYSFPEVTVISPPDISRQALPYLDKSIDLIAVPAENQELIAEARRVATQAVLLIDGNLDCQVEWLSDVPAELAAVSIVISVHNHAATTAACLSSLVETLPQSFRGEIIVVDDASTDDTPSLLEQWAARDARFRCLRNDVNQGFLESAKRGAAAARGEILLFLNNDTILLPEWLPPLLRVFGDFADAGAVGGRLLFPDGALQEAGGMVFADGSAAHFGRGDCDLAAPHYNFIREVDYCSGALLATRRTLFEQIGGFDDRYRPAYYEDTDYCFAVRQYGFRVFYQPESVVVHLEGVSSGTDLSQGVKQHQVINQVKFAEKWSAALSRQAPRPAGNDRVARLAVALGRPSREGGPL
jgi:GT2 family glycosyltransferase